MKLIKPFGRGWPAGRLRVSLCDQSPEVVRALASQFEDVTGVEILEGNLLDIDCDSLVSPANSFGDMGGGIDQPIDRFYDGLAQPEVMARIGEQFCGELPVGMAIIIEMPTRRFPYLISAPTMRVPGNVSGTINAYLSMRAAFVAIRQHNSGNRRPIGSVAVPGLCTGVGCMLPEVAAVQMRAAYDMVVGDCWKKVTHPAFAPFVFCDRTQGAN